MTQKTEFTLYTDYQPGLIGRIASLHGRGYVEKWKFWKFFECKVASELSIFMECYDPTHSCIWSLERNGEYYGSITLDGTHAQKEGAHLRWFILDEDAKRQGWGKRLLEEAIRFARDHNFPSIYLWTLKGLEPAGQLYRNRGFQLEESLIGDQWGVEVQEEKLRLILNQDK